MTRELFTAQLVSLQHHVLTLGSMAEKALLGSMDALRNGDLEWSKRIVEGDRLIDRERLAIEDETIFVIATQQPLATDLRTLASVLYISTDLERIADHAEGIAKVNLLLGDEALPRRLGYLPAMADRAVSMLRNSLTAYIACDLASARQISAADDEVDRLQLTVYHQCFKAMMTDHSSIERNTYITWCAHNLERIADRCTNICERIIYTQTGQMD